MEKYELPLVIFTVLSQMSVGMTLLLTWRTLRGEVIGNRMHWLITGLILGVASVAAVLHLAHPEHAYNALINLKHAWLSREILGATLYGAMIGLAFLSKGNKGAALLASLFGILLVVVQGMTYAGTGDAGYCQRHHHDAVLCDGLGDGLCRNAAAWAESIKRCAAPGDYRPDGAADCRAGDVAQRWHYHEDDRSRLAKLAALSGQPAVLRRGRRVVDEAPADAESGVCAPAGGRGAQPSDLLRRYRQHHRQYWSPVLINKTPRKRGFLLVFTGPPSPECGYGGSRWRRSTPAGEW